MTKKNKKVQVSVGISALNEESNIRNVIFDILSQKKDGWGLKEILVYCDGSKDRTPELVKSIKSSYIKCYESKTNKGKVYRTNQILKAFKGDYIIIVDADVRLKDSYVINDIIKEFYNGNKVAMVCGNVRVYPPKTFFQKAIYTSYYVYYKSRSELNNGNNFWGCSGACLALERNIAKKIVIPPEIITEDVFIYFTVVSKGYSFRLAKSAVVYFKMVDNLKDYLRQIFRTNPEAVRIMSSDYFGEIVEKETSRPKIFYIKSVLESISINPLGALVMIFIKIFCYPLFPYFSGKYKLSWFTAVSSK